jgi:ABC-type lipoprotein export system ATPase subunit
MVTHNLELARKADRQFEMLDGGITECHEAKLMHS